MASVYFRPTAPFPSNMNIGSHSSNRNISKHAYFCSETSLKLKHAPTQDPWENISCSDLEETRDTSALKKMTHKLPPALHKPYYSPKVKAEMSPCCSLSAPNCSLSLPGLCPWPRALTAWIQKMNPCGHRCCGHRLWFGKKDEPLWAGNLIFALLLVNSWKALNTSSAF